MKNEIETINIEERRQIIIVGKTSAGKSKLLNEDPFLEMTILPIFRLIS